jgi:hypothetical protein
VPAHHQPYHLAYRAAHARIYMERRPLDGQWVADYQDDAIMTCRQRGEDPLPVLDQIAEGLAAAALEAHAGTGPAVLSPTGGTARPDRHFGHAEPLLPSERISA